MPVRIENLKDDFDFVYDPPVGTATRAMLLPEFGVTLRKMGPAEDKYQTDGKYFETNVQLPNWKAAGLFELFGFEADWFLDPEIPGLDEAQQAKIGFQLSIDGGANWLVWDTGMWQDAVGPLANVFNDTLTVDENIPELPFGNPRQVRIKARFTPGANGRQRPVLVSTYIYNRHKMDLFEDVARSMKRYLDNVIEVPMYYNTQFDFPAKTINVENGNGTPGLDVKISPDGIEVYNTTTDPGRNNNLFLSFDGNRKITMTSQQQGVMEVRFTGIPDVFIGAEEFFQVSKIPSVVINVERIEQYLLVRANVPETERSIARGVGRLQFHRLFYRIFVTVRVQSSLKREASQMTESICRVLDWGDEFMGVANGEHYCVLEPISEEAEDRIGEGLFVGAVKLKLLGKCWLKGEVEDEANLKDCITGGLIPLVKFVDVSLGGDSQYTLSLPPDLRKVYRELQVIDQNS